MSTDRISIRYAKALFEQAVSTGSLEAIYADLNVVNNALKDSKELRNLIKNPIIKSDKKAEILNQIFSGKVSMDTLNFLNMVAKNARESYLQGMIGAFFNQYNSLKNISEVTVTTAVELTPATETEIVRFIQKQTGNPNVKINKSLDASIMGGFIVNFGDKVYDNSVKYKLDKIRKEIII